MSQTANTFDSRPFSPARARAAIAEYDPHPELTVEAVRERFYSDVERDPGNSYSEQAFESWEEYLTNDLAYLLDL